MVINFIHFFWPSLVQMQGFLCTFITPVLKAIKKSGKEEIPFYTLPQYRAWVDERGGSTKGYKIKYYKGLGTSTSKEAQEYFTHLDQNRIFYTYEDESDDAALELAFTKTKTNERKKWIEDYNNEDIDVTQGDVTYKDFINKQLIQFSIYDNQRSIPSMCDGLKPSERKILYAVFKKNLKDEIKVAQLVGYVSEHSAYHVNIFIFNLLIAWRTILIWMYYSHGTEFRRK